jgi:glycerophosphoryl diester phosphodiesterase
MTDRRDAHRPALIAHRGYSQCYPENTLVGLEAALRAGAQCVEFDVHFTADSVPVVFHDNDLARVTGNPGIIQQTSFAELRRLRASEFSRFGDAFLEEPVPSLQDVLSLLKQWASVTAFVEIKTATIKHFGVDQVVPVLMDALNDFQKQCILISFDRGVLEYARKAGMSRIGWAIREWSDDFRAQAQALSPDVLFCDVEIIGNNDLWPGPWQWALYDVVDPDEALRWFSRGAGYIETWDIGGMLSDPRLKQGNAND